jgi:ABC-type transport system involved in Fe-S cluster assembly fused permease/ATPase subunit
MLKEWISQALDANSAMALKSATFTQLMSLSSDFHDSKRSGELYSAIDHAESIISLLNMSAFKAVPMVVDLLIACSYLVGIFGPYMCLILAYTVLLFIYTQHHLAPDESKIIQEYMVHAQKESQVMHDSTGNYKTVAYFHRFDYEIDRYATSVKANRACRTKMFRSFDAIAACRVACLEFGRWSALLFAAFLVQGGTKSFSDFVLLYTYWRTMSGIARLTSNASLHLLTSHAQDR